MNTDHLNREAVDYVLTTTRVVRKRLDFERAVPRELVTEAIRVAVQAPTADDMPRWHWYVADDLALKAQLKEAQQQYELRSESSKFKGDAAAAYREMVNRSAPPIGSIPAFPGSSAWSPISNASRPLSSSR
ncbi:nitroreductase family protein [Mycobacteroides abscessus]|uniref:nitroreductase family protein n=1 Tax=Mycobacteroides abscessus TaxID=36809 RepID=UPI000C25929A|nr:nitroreductase family protein [Mycobacteroides abscessus]